MHFNSLRFLLDNQIPGRISIRLSSTYYHWAFPHSHTSLALPVYLRKEPPEIRTLCIRAIIFHDREADFFSSAKMALHEWSIELRWKRVACRGNAGKASVFKM